jgi:hypothetical protein
MQLIVLRRPEPARPPAEAPQRRGTRPGQQHQVRRPALVIALTVPGAGFWSLLALLLRVPLERLLRRLLGVWVLFLIAWVPP